MAQKEKELSGYELSKDFFEFSFENTGKVKPTHIALYFFCMEHWNRLGWKKQFGLPRQMAMDAIGVKNNRTYTSAFENLVEWGFLKVIEKSQNQYSATVIAMVKNTSACARANTSALSKATHMHSHKQRTGIAPIDKPITIEPITIEPKSNISPDSDSKKEVEYYSEFLKVWFTVYEEKFKTKPTMTETDGKKLKSIIQKLKNKSADSNYDWGPASGEKLFRHFLEIAYSDTWIRDNYQLQILDNKFDIIINKGKNGATNKNTGADMQDLKDRILRGEKVA